MRRTTRVRERSGELLEDLGVTPDIQYRMTNADVLDHNEGLIDRAIAELASQLPHSIDVTGVQRHRDRAPTVRVETQNVERLETTTVDGHNMPSEKVRGNKAKIELDEVVPPGSTGTVGIRILGYVGSELVAERRAEIDVD
jgi:hypothetical protein